MKRIIWISILLVFVAIQFIPVKKPVQIQDNPGDFLSVIEVPDSIADLLKTSCYDCHSNTTHYPFYAYVAPSSWLVARDVRLAREELNFSTWSEYDLMKQAGYLAEIAEEVNEGEMPMGIYTALHRKAKLNSAEREMIDDWANRLGESLFN